MTEKELMNVYGGISLIAITNIIVNLIYILKGLRKFIK